MNEKTLTTDKNDVYEEVAKTTSYAGAKMDDATAYDKIFTTDADKEMLERFWQESKNTVCNVLKKQLVKEEETDGTYRLTLGLSAAFEDCLLPGMERSLRSFFVENIISKWFIFANKGEASVHAASAATHIEDIKRKALFKQRPTRPDYQ